MSVHIGKAWKQLTAKLKVQHSSHPTFRQLRTSSPGQSSDFVKKTCNFLSFFKFTEYANMSTTTRTIITAYYVLATDDPCQKYLLLMPKSGKIWPCCFEVVGCACVETRASLHTGIRIVVGGSFSLGWWVWGRLMPGNHNVTPFFPMLLTPLGRRIPIRGKGQEKKNPCQTTTHAELHSTRLSPDYIQCPNTAPPCTTHTTTVSPELHI